MGKLIFPTRDGIALVDEDIGSLEPGKQADLVILDIPDYRHLSYHFGINHVWKVIKKGGIAWEK